ncbi:MAG: hypothetical protein KDJ77_14740 [Rhodobiaceae bacterium]|nr:hypothetical protein [Rhodobiaceae bacterium]
MTYFVEHDGRTSEFPDDSLLIFVDETGHENFADPGAPFFGLGGCLCSAGSYQNLIELPWKSVEANFVTYQLPLHAADLDPKNLSCSQLTALGNFFVGNDFGRFATVIKASFENEVGVDTFQLATVSTFDLILQIIRKLGGTFSHIVLISEHSQRLDSQYADYFHRQRFAFQDGSLVPFFHATQSKASGEDYPAGLAVADFVAHTAGSMSRSSKGGKRPVVRQDFNTIFQHNLSAHLFIDAARKPANNS